MSRDTVTDEICKRMIAFGIVGCATMGIVALSSMVTRYFTEQSYMESGYEQVWDDDAGRVLWKMPADHRTNEDR